MKETQIKPTSRKATIYRGVECLNCGHPLDLSDRYCAYCGQLNTTKRLSLLDFFNEFILSVFTYDSRFRFTVIDLLFKPGTITRNYVQGKRLKYANPFRFFLSASIFYFILLALMNLVTQKETFNFVDEDAIKAQTEKAIEDIDLDKVADDLDLSQLDNLSDEEADQIEEKINEGIKKGISFVSSSDDEEKTYDKTPEDSLDGGFANRWVNKAIVFYEFYNATDISNATQAMDSLHYQKSNANLMLYSKHKDFERIKDNPAKFFGYLASKTPFFLFFFAPIFAMIFWFIYPSKKFNYMEHLVFIFHIFSWVFVVLIISLIPDTLIGNNVFAAILLLFVGPFYFYKALRNFYKQKRTWTLIKFVFLNFIFYIGATFFAVIFFAITAFLF